MPNQIGTVGPTRRSIQPASPSVSAEAFGAGIGQALGSLSQSYATQAIVGQDRAESDQAVSLAWKERQDKLTLANLNVEFLKTENALSLGLAEKYKNADPGAPGLTNAARAEADEEFNKFLATVPDRMKPQFLARVEQSRETIVNGAFQLEVEAGNSEFKRNVGLFQQDAVNKLMGAVATDPASIDVLAAKLAADADELFKGSPLSKVESRNLRQQLKVVLDTARFARLAQDEAQGLSNNGGQVPGRLQHEGNAWKSSAPVAAGLPAVAVGLLTSIAGPESGGEYNVMYSPEGRRYFQDFSKHPNQPAMIADGPRKGQFSSAAGKYMMIKSTWDRAQKALGLSDFSPESQDLGTWYIAQVDYKAATGRNLLDVLSSGNVPAILAAKRVLENTWVGLKNKTDEQFLADVTGATANPTSLIYDEEFSDVPYDQRVALALDAQSKAAAIQQKINAEATAQQKASFESAKQSVAAGDMGMADIQQLSIQHNFDYDQQEELKKILKNTNEQAYNAAQFVSSASIPGYTISPDDSEGKKNAAAFFAQPDGDGMTADQHLANSDAEYVQRVLRPITAQTQFIPPNVVQSLKTYMGSGNQNQALFALDTMNQLRADNPAEFERAFGNDANLATSLYNVTKGTMEPSAMLGYIRMENDPQMRPVIDMRKKAVAENVKNNPDDFMPAGIVDKMGFEGTASVDAGNAISAEFWPLYTYMYQATGDHDKAMQGAADVLKQRWGDATVNGETQFMRYPPTITAPVFDGTQDYIDEQLQRDFGLTPDMNVRLVSDSQTEAEYMGGRPASYKLVQLDNNGFPSKVFTQADLPGFDPKTDREIGQRIARWYPQITPQMRATQVDRLLATDEISKLRKEKWAELAFGSNGDFMTARVDEQKVDELNRRINTLQMEIKYGRKDYFQAPSFYKPLEQIVKLVPEQALRDLAPDVARIKNPATFEEAIDNLKSLKAKVEKLPQTGNTYSFINRIDAMLEELGWYPQVTEQMKMEQVTTIQPRDKVARLRAEQFNLGDLAPERYKELERQIGIEEGKIAHGRENILESPKLFDNIISGMRPALPTSGSALQQTIDDLKNFKPKTPQEASDKLNDIMQNTVPNIYPVFQRWEIQMRIQKLLKELG